ncbi:MAG: PEP-CTERM sorting domain-containing protein [Methylacidiphilales bacterium]|nr:PEP-CTERM sorting domain-containing protein [Candidatus Methylacidiphilales bacterium]
MGVALDGSGKNGKALSHASLFIAKKPPQKKVPEPSIIFGLSALAAGSLAMKKKILILPLNLKTES